MANALNHNIVLCPAKHGRLTYYLRASFSVLTPRKDFSYTRRVSCKWFTFTSKGDLKMMIRTRNPYFRLVDDLLSDAFGSGGQFEARGFGLALDVEESKDAYIVRANLPGVSLDDIRVNIHEDVLTIAGETVSAERAEDSRLLIRERRSGKFSRSLRFPTVVNGEAVEADFADGVLSITLPKAEHVKPRQIPVKVSATGD